MTRRHVFDVSPHADDQSPGSYLLDHAAATEARLARANGVIAAVRDLATREGEASRAAFLARARAGVDRLDPPHAAAGFCETVRRMTGETA